jgi:hypothetical protein
MSDVCDDFMCVSDDDEEEEEEEEEYLDLLDRYSRLDYNKEDNFFEIVECIKKWIVSAAAVLIIWLFTHRLIKGTNGLLSYYLKNENKKIVEDLSEAAIRERMHKDKYI